jgi:hypothetical protein
VRAKLPLYLPQLAPSSIRGRCREPSAGVAPSADPAQTARKDPVTDISCALKPCPQLADNRCCPQHQEAVLSADEIPLQRHRHEADDLTEVNGQDEVADVLLALKEEVIEDIGPLTGRAG